MSGKFVGGRGVKAPYKTKTLRVPLDLHGYFSGLVESYRRKMLEDQSQSPLSVAEYVIRRGDLVEPPSRIIEEAKKIVKQRKSVKKSITKLLQVIVDPEITESDLD
jgi:hypothetical protein